MFGAFHGGLVALGFATFTRGVPTEQLPVVTTSASPASPTTLRVATLNLAHGRSTGRNQVLQSSARLISQVHAAAALVSGGIAARSRPPGGRRSGTVERGCRSAIPRRCGPGSPRLRGRPPCRRIWSSVRHRRGVQVGDAGCGLVHVRDEPTNTLQGLGGRFVGVARSPRRRSSGRLRALGFLS